MQAKEESVEMGGYFICNGIERIIRMLIQQRRHYIMALRRGAYHKRGKDYTDCATLIRSELCLAVTCAEHGQELARPLLLYGFLGLKLPACCCQTVYHSWYSHTPQRRVLRGLLLIINTPKSKFV